MNQDYTDARATIIAMDKTQLTKASEAAVILKTAFEDARTAVASILAEYTGIDGPAIGAQQNIMSLQTSLNMMTYQVDAAVNMIAAGLASYDPAPAMPMPAPMPAPRSDTPPSQ